MKATFNVTAGPAAFAVMEIEEDEFVSWRVAPFTRPEIGADPGTLKLQVD